MSQTEAGVLIDRNGKPIYWHLPDNRSIALLPDSHELWDQIWRNRRRLLGFAHSHPGCGIPGPSHEDITTFAAIESALGKRLIWWIVSEDAVVELVWTGPDRLCYDYQGKTFSWVLELRGKRMLSWVQELRDLSGFPHWVHNDPSVVDCVAKQIADVEDERILTELENVVR